jgi:hypothetical protein
MPSPKQSISLLALLLQFLDPCSIAFAWPTSSLLDSLGLERSSYFANCLEHVVVHFGNHMEHAKLMVCIGPDFCDRFGIQRRAIENHGLG